jgi:molybdate transport system ATP-binding protein
MYSTIQPKDETSPHSSDADKKSGVLLELSMPRHFAQGPQDLNIRLTLPPGQWLSVRGASGAGKSSLLRALAGLDRPLRGRIVVNHVSWLDTATGHNLPTRHRSIGYVFQDLALFPHLTARKQLQFALNASQDRARVNELLDRFGLHRLSDRLPHELSGGQQQRLALARALARAPELLLLDEPLSALDSPTRHEMQTLLSEIAAQDTPLAVLLVTHDDAEAKRLTHRSILIEQGRVLEDIQSFPHRPRKTP